LGGRQLWKSLLDFLDKSNAWTDGAVLDDNNGTRLSIEAIKQEVDDYTTRAYKMSKALKEVSKHSPWQCCTKATCCQIILSCVHLSGKLQCMPTGAVCMSTTCSGCANSRCALKEVSTLDCPNLPHIDV
jgi:hypothetical protein